MSNMQVMGGGSQQMMNNADTPNSTLAAKSQPRLNTYIYDYFLRNEMYDAARVLLDKCEIDTVDKSNADKKGINGTHDEDSKDDIPGKPADLPLAAVSHDATSSFLQDWWSQFWDCWNAARGKGTTQNLAYLQFSRARNMEDRKRPAQMGPMQNNMVRNPMAPNGMTSMDVKKAMMMQNRQQQNPQAQQQMRLQQMAAQNMQREGSQMGMNGQRPHTPASGDNAPSPKRQRMDGTDFNGQMMPMGRGQNPGMQQQQMNAMQFQNGNPQIRQMQQTYSTQMAASMQNAIDASGQKGMQNPNGFSQGSPAMDGNAEVFAAANARNMQPGAVNTVNGSNHALQDYQMQLMLLEQQNKKRLLMARQEQETNPTAQGGAPGAPSPAPEDQMKRNTPKMMPNGIPQAAMDAMAQSRGSPAVGFDASGPMGPNIPHNFQGMKMPGGMMAPNGQMMPATSHPAFNAQMNGQLGPQQMEMMRRVQAGQPGGPWPQPGPGMMQGGQPQQAPNMTPQQRNSAMPPPPAPAGGEVPNRTQPSSPQQTNAAPPTPSQANKPNPKSKKEAAHSKSKKAANKKGGTTAATPASEAGDQPPTPTPAPPITPTAPAQQFGKNGPQGLNGQPPNAQPNAVAPPQQSDVGASFGTGLDGGEMSFDMNFGGIDGDVLDNFDFDSFLNSNDGGEAFAFDGNMNFGADGGLEAGGEV